MVRSWDESRPIYLQLRDRIVAAILKETLVEGGRLPSVRHTATTLQLNALTVLRTYRQLVMERVIENRRGRGMYVVVGARVALLGLERERFFEQEWPRVHDLINLLGLRVEDLPAPVLSHHSDLLHTQKSSSVDT